MAIGIPGNAAAKVERVITAVKAPLLLTLFLPVAGMLFGRASNAKSPAQLQQRLEQGTS